MPLSNVGSTSRAIGSTRGPDERLIRNPAVAGVRLRSLQQQILKLETSGHKVFACNRESCASCSTWESILAKFRVLTSSVTAGADKFDPEFLVVVYEAAADSGLLGGNLAFFLTCLSRLLNDLYGEAGSSGNRHYERESEFVEYGVLYFGVVHKDATEVNRMLQKHCTRMSVAQSFALRVVTSVASRDGIRFLDLYTTATTRQKCIMHEAVAEMRSLAAQTIVRVYMSLEVTRARILLRAESNEEVFKVICAEQPSLADSNPDDSAKVIFLRVRKVSQ